MSEICMKCGLPKDLCVCETIAKETQNIIVTTELKRFRKVHTVIKGIDNAEINMRDLAKKLKAKLACGGTAKDGMIDLQGDHKTKIKQILVKLGFSPETIKIR